MWAAVGDGLAYLSAQSMASLLALFWIVALFELPRYGLSFLTALVLGPRPHARPAGDIGRVSMIIAGHNEADAVERCVACLREQTRPPDEIIVVSDGSTDAMPARIGGMQRRGLIDQAHVIRLRAGKSAAFNLAARQASGDILVNVDLDCTFDRDALRNIVAPFADARVGAVSGNVMVRNRHASLVAAFQAIEYLISISLGKSAALLTDQVVCVSGCFGAFRREALAGVGHLDVGGGEDLDVTMRLRKAGWKIAFAAEAIAYSQVPETLTGLTGQRFRWERDAVRLRYRKHGELMNPFSRRFLFTEFLHEIEFVFFNVLAAAALPLYIVWLVLAYGDLAPVILLAAQLGLFCLDLVTFAVAALAVPRAQSLPFMPYVFGYSLFNGIFMRLLRLAAYLQEWLFDASSRDAYVPAKVHLLRRW